MAITINGSGTVTGLAVGGLPDGTVDNDTIAAATIADAKMASGGGKVLQVVQAIRTTNFSSSATSYIDTGLSRSITPSSTSSKILVLVSQQGFYSGAQISAYVNLVRESTQVTETYFQSQTTGQGYFANTISYLDSPSTTSAITYKTQAKNSEGRIMYLSWGTNGKAYITLMEIGA